MYKIEAIIHPDRLDQVKEALLKQGFPEFVVAEAHGHGSRPGQIAQYRGVAYEIPFVHQARVELSMPGLKS